MLACEHTWSVPNILGPGPGPVPWLAQISVRYQDQDCVCFNSQDRDCPGPGLGPVSSPVARTRTWPRPGPRHQYWPGLSSNPPRIKTLSRGTGNRCCRQEYFQYMLPLPWLDINWFTWFENESVFTFRKLPKSEDSIYIICKSMTGGRWEGTQFVYIN